MAGIAAGDAPLVALPHAPFDVRLYWTSFYRDRPFFGELDQWAAPRREASFRRAE
jgi:hypothetical protein